MISPLPGNAYRKIAASADRRRILVSADQGGADSANGYSFARSFSSISRKGRFVVFESFATDLEAINRAQAGLVVDMSTVADALYERSAG